MKKLVVILIVVMMSSVVSAIASDMTASLAMDQVVVDRSTRNKTLNDYTLLTRDAIQKAWTTPLDLAVPGALKGKITINYGIKRSGALESVELVRGSGNPDMDRTLMQAIRSAAPFPAFPDEINAGRVLVKANFIVAELPTIPVITVEHPVNSDNTTVAGESDRAERKYNWGVSAGTAHKKEATEVKELPVPAPPVKKYLWGLQP